VATVIQRAVYFALMDAFLGLMALIISSSAPVEIGERVALNVDVNVTAMARANVFVSAKAIGFVIVIVMPIVALGYHVY
jgi:hypothetical protein